MTTTNATTTTVITAATIAATPTASTTAISKRITQNAEDASLAYWPCFLDFLKFGMEVHLNPLLMTCTFYGDP